MKQKQVVEDIRRAQRALGQPVASLEEPKQEQQLTTSLAHTHKAKINAAMKAIDKASGAWFLSPGGGDDKVKTALRDIEAGIRKEKNLSRDQKRMAEELIKKTEERFSREFFDRLADVYDQMEDEMDRFAESLHNFGA